jgi:hypothetical protein
MSAQYMGFIAVFQVPQPHGVVSAPGDEVSAVRGKGQARDNILVSAEPTEHPSLVEVPQTNVIIACARFKTYVVGPQE